MEALQLSHADSTDLLFGESCLEPTLEDLMGFRSSSGVLLDDDLLKVPPLATVKQEVMLPGSSRPAAMSAVRNLTLPRAMPLTLPPLSAAAMRAAGPPPSAPQTSATLVSVERPTATATEWSAETAPSAAGTDCEGAGTSARRRRRVRDHRQQELNRLAQQRYRQRKKQRQSDLQTTVDDLATQLSQLKTLENEVSSLKKTHVELRKQLALQQNTLQQAHERLVSQDRTIVQQRAVIEAQKAALERTGAASVEALTERLVPALRAALGEAGAAPALVQPGMVKDALARVLSACWKDLANVGGRQADKAAGPAPITVSCC